MLTPALGSLFPQCSRPCWPNSGSGNSHDDLYGRATRLARELKWMRKGLAVFAAVLIGIDIQVKEIFTVKKEAKFKEMKLSGCTKWIGPNGIAAAYSLVQVLSHLLMARIGRGPQNSFAVFLNS
ncbi:hypothetical protein ACH5RR_026517 [Cinchona calisaya]|uniref:CASP-like protein n=1 Tax=Cinchona calisaya TaxID=153742 RepID=A0ABD2Z2T6_9GENT